MNVAITRAKSYLFVVAHAETLRNDKNWGDFVSFFSNKWIKCKSKQETRRENLLSVMANPAANGTSELEPGEVV